jgi:4-hydroxy-tetrahydrodipicolinate synthase
MKNLKGVFTALVTPFLNGKVDFVSLEVLVKKQIQEGIDGFVVNGTTGESPTLTHEERRDLVIAVKSWCSPSMPIIMGTGTNSTQDSIQNSIQAEKWGADALLLVVPYYNKPPQRGLLEHFKNIASATQLPSLLYNVPGRTVAALEVETIKKLSEHPQIVGIKEATGNIELAKSIRIACGKEFILLSGDDGTYDEFMAAGGDGVISVATHVIPRQMKRQEARLHLDLINALFCEANPIPVKMALHLMGVIKSAECRLPLVSLSPAHTEKLGAILKKEGLLK